MRTTRAKCLLAVVCLTWLSAERAAAQTQRAAWLGISRIDPFDYSLSGNWLDLATGQTPNVPPDANWEVFFDARAGQAPRDAEGNVVVSLRNDDPAARIVTLSDLPFRFIEDGPLAIGNDPNFGGILSVQQNGRLILDTAQFDVFNSAYVGGGVQGPTGPASLFVGQGGSLQVGDTLRLWNTGQSLLQLEGGRVDADIIDLDGNSQQFQWQSGDLTFREFRGDLTNFNGLLSPSFPFATIEGDFTQVSGGTTNLRLGGTAPGQTHDVLNVAGNLNASGTLSVSLLPGFVPSAGDAFDVLDFGSLTGQFQILDLPELPEELEWDVADLHTQGILRVLPTMVPVTSVQWTGAAGDGDYFNPANWSPQLVPDNRADVHFALAVPAGGDIRLAGGDPVAVTELSLASGGLFQLSDGAEFEVSEQSSLSGQVQVVDPGSTFTAVEAPPQLVGGPQLLARNGGRIALASEQFEVSEVPESATLVSADGARSSVELSSLESIRVNTPTDRSLLVNATNGGEVDMSGLTEIVGVANGPGQLVLRADSGGTLRLGGSGVSERTVLEVDGANSAIEMIGGLALGESSSVHLANDGMLRLAAPFFNDGTISGTGTIEGTVFNDGTISPGSSTGHLAFCGDLVATDNGVFMFEIEDRTPETGYDKIVACRRITLAGHLDVSFIDGSMGVYEPVKGDSFELFRADQGISGRFDSVSLPAIPPAWGWRLLYDEMALSLMVTQRLPGDFDADGDVDRDDVPLWQAGVGTFMDASQTDGDANGDGNVDGHDLLDYLLHFGRSDTAALASATPAVPEPNSALMLGMVAAAYFASDRFRRGFRRGTMDGRPQEQMRCSTTLISSGPSQPPRRSSRLPSGRHSWKASVVHDRNSANR